MKKTLAGFAIAVVMLATSVTGWFAVKNREVDIIDLDQISLKQFNWSSRALFEKPFSELITEDNPLLSTWAVWANFYSTRDAAEASKRLDQIIAKYNLNRMAKLTYGFQHEKLAPGWWSGMDMFFMPMVLVAVAEKTGNENYIGLARKMLDLALTSPEEGGSMWPDNGSGCWLSEYSWEGMKREDEYYVLNGHLFALTSLKILADKLGSPKLQSAFECATAGTVKLADRFLKDTKWPLYMLHKPTINPPHYLLFEQLQFAGLYQLSGYPFFKQQEINRSDVFSRYYPVYLVNGREGRTVFFSSSGNPHPYNLDLFEIHLNCSDGDQSVSYQTDNRRGFMRWAFAFGPSPATPTCSVMSNYMDQAFEIYQTNWFREVNSDDAAVTIASPIYPSLDAVKGEDGWIKIDPSVTSSPPGEKTYLDDEARLDLKFPNRALSDAAIVSIEVETDAPMKMAVRLHDGDMMVERYLIPGSAGIKQIMSFSKLGFEGADDLMSIDGITLVIFTDKMTQPAHIRLGRVSIAENQYEFFRVLEKSDGAVVFEK
ncbi:D-glucuronyl C5-epimerase family protein [Mesorhizobium sp. NPDC059025]|uniref:D-glucuronyl C5-epimerase family protein n=1 Tax=unclassified Mesorhizobium TaxID=325217 RepID=UPI00369B03E9